ncbi:dihydrofolate reductase family protein [Niveispirillum sp.]|uniref:RibD family protein n=1 Tax=Niveispirillum sp. TaxID=1917217 RepID=UPI001B44353F|nr:dihydrofolate reductase family protein [Niveispirillum sp.]MBP7338747.1 dihydrofolate reductase family protein [Niveispirillum sp.]
MEWVHLSVCMSLDGHIDSDCGRRLILSSEEDCHDMHAVRADCDAILVGAATVRRDQPRLTVRYPELLAARRARGMPDHPTKVVVTFSGDLDPDSAFFQKGGPVVVLCEEEALPAARARLGTVATVIGVAAADGVAGILARLDGMGVRRLMVEGGCQVLTQFLAAGAFHRLRVAVAPFLLGRAGAPRLAGPAFYPHGPDNRLRILSTRTLGNVAVIDMENTDPRVLAG